MLTSFSLNFLYSCSTAAENVQYPPYGPLHDYYLAQSTDGGPHLDDASRCTPGGSVGCQTTHVESACQTSGKGVAGQAIRS